MPPTARIWKKSSCGWGSIPVQVSRASNINLSLFQGGAKPDEMAQFCFYLEQLVKGGVPLIEGLTDLRDSVDNKSLREVTGVVIQEVESGTTLSEALRKHPKFFNEVFIALISAGEQSGELARVLNALGDTIKWTADVRKKTRKVIMYPGLCIHDNSSCRLLSADLRCSASYRSHYVIRAGVADRDCRPD